MGISGLASGMLQLSVVATAQPAAKLAVQQAIGTLAVPLVSKPSFKLPTAALTGGNASQTIRAGEPCKYWVVQVLNMQADTTKHPCLDILVF